MTDGPRRPVVSVITPTYNRRHFLPTTIGSVFAQTLAEIEMIVLDDGSTDDTVSLLQEWAEREPERFRWDRHDNMGQVRTVNKGFEMARGEYLYVLNSDDYIYPDCLERLVAGLRANPDAVIAFGDWRVVDEDDQVIYELELADLSSIDIIRNMIPVGAGVLYSRRIVDANHGWNPEYPISPDFEFWLKASLVGPLVHVPGYAAVWRQHGETITVQSRGLANTEQFFRLYQWYFGQDDLPEEIRAVEAEAYRNLHIVCAIGMMEDAPKATDRFVLLDRWAWTVDAQANKTSLEAELLAHQEQAVRFFELDAVRLQQIEDERAYAGRLEALSSERLTELEAERAHAARLAELAESRLRELEAERERADRLAAQVQAMSLRGRLHMARTRMTSRLR